MTERIPVAVYGATGLVGQRLVMRLAEHPWFELIQVAASRRSAGLTYAEAVNNRWLQSEAIPASVAELRVSEPTPDSRAPIIFSALDSATARQLEPELASRGAVVCSNASAHRLDPRVPLVIPELNGRSLSLIENQPWPGALICNTNCAVSGIAMALAPLQRNLGINSVSIVTLQSISGAGAEGLNALAIFDDLLPDIPGEAEKIAAETGVVLQMDCPVDVQTWRVPVCYGHSFSLRIETRRPVDVERVAAAIQTLPGLNADLPSAPDDPLVFCAEAGRPRPSDLRTYDSMAVLVGGLEQQGDTCFTIRGCVDNLERGAAGAAVLNAEWACSHPQTAPLIFDAARA